MRISDRKERFPLSGVVVRYEVTEEPELVRADVPVRTDGAAPSGESWWVAVGGGQLTLSLFWTAYSTALVVTGVRRAVAGLRWQGLSLFGIVVAKVFLIDLSYLSGGYRVLSSIVLGIVLLAVSFLYQRGLAAQAAR